MTTPLILGAKGMLGTQLAQLLPGAFRWDKEEADVTDFADLERRVRSLRPVPGAIVNCVAFNDVDGAEGNHGAAFALNAEFPGRLAGLARDLGVPLVHYSTNYVFDGERGEYGEDDPPAPLSVYGHSKLRGEQLVAANAPRHYLIRTSVIFGPRGSSALSKKSFVDLMLELSARSPEIRAVTDEINSLTYAPDLAAATLGLLHDRRPWGVYHVTNAGAASWYEFAREIFRLAGRSVELRPASASEFPRPARRPRWAALRNTKLPALRSWEQALAECLSRPIEHV